MGTEERLAFAPSYDESRWPIVVVTLPASTPSLDDFQRRLDRLSLYHERGEPWGLIIDTRYTPPMPAAHRRLLAQQLDRDTRRYPMQMSRCAVVVESGVARSVIAAVAWRQRSPYQMEPFSSMDEAVAWMQAELAGMKKG